MYKYKLELKNKKQNLLPYSKKIKFELNKAVSDGEITFYDILTFTKDTIIVVVDGENNKEWHKKFGYNLKNRHGLGHLCSPPNSSVMFGRWKEI